MKIGDILKDKSVPNYWIVTSLPNTAKIIILNNKLANFEYYTDLQLQWYEIVAKQEFLEVKAKLL